MSLVWFVAFWCVIEWTGGEFVDLDAELYSGSGDSYEWEMLQRDTFRYYSKLKVLRKELSKKKEEGKPTERYTWPLFSVDHKMYHCSIPYLAVPIEEREVKKEEEEQVEVLPFLEDLQDRCLYRLEGWWTYEFCYGKHVRQFHQDKDGTIVASFNLGLKTDASKGVAGEDFYYEKFSKGTVCDLTAQPRTCEIRYYCSPEAEVSSLSSIKEPSSCNYIIRIDTPLLCKHPEYAYTVKEATEKIFCFEAPVPALEDIEIEEADLEWKKQKEATQAANAVKEKTTTTTETTPEPATTTTTTKTKKKKKTAATVSDDAAKTTNVNQDNTKEATPTETKNTPPNVLDVSLDPIDPLKELGQTEPVNDVNEENGVKIAFLSEADLSDLIEDFNSAQDELDLKKLKQVFDGFDEVKRKPPASREDKEKKKDKKDL